nr:protein phosphatase 2C domain-containing protein [Nitrospirillum iridis]
MAKGRQLPPNSKIILGHDPTVLLLGGESVDITTDEPPLALTLTDNEIGWIRAPGNGAVAATWYGPDEQTKSSNQDFALAARICGYGGREYIFAAVADGVTTRTFWAARSARLACLTALRVMAQAVTSKGEITDNDLTNLRVGLAKALRDVFERDKAVLVASNAVPEGWSTDVYNKNRGNPAYWYNSTLLVSVLGDDVGVILFAGDGGIHVSKRTKGVTGVPIRPLKTGEGLEISSFVSLSVTEADFRAARLSDIQSLDSVDIVMATDGVDRTLQIECPDDYDTLNLSSSSSALGELKRLGMMPKREVDNYSIARLTWPINAAPGGRRRTLASPVSVAEPTAVSGPASVSASFPVDTASAFPVAESVPAEDNYTRRFPIGIAASSVLVGASLTLGIMAAFNFSHFRDTVVAHLLGRQNPENGTVPVVQAPATGASDGQGSVNAAADEAARNAEDAAVNAAADEAARNAEDAAVNAAADEAARNAKDAAVNAAADEAARNAKDAAELGQGAWTQEIERLTAEAKAAAEANGGMQTSCLSTKSKNGVLLDPEKMVQPKEYSIEKRSSERKEDIGSDVLKNMPVLFCANVDSEYKKIITKNIAGKFIYEPGKKGFIYSIDGPCVGTNTACAAYFIVATKDTSGVMSVYRVAIRNKTTGEGAR